MPTNLKPTAASAKLSILNFAKSMVSPSTYRALGIILSTCCEITATATATCSPKGGGLYNILVTLSSPISLAGAGTAFAVGKTLPVTVQDNQTQILLPDYPGSPGSSTFTLQLLLGLGHNPTSGSSTVVGYVIPGVVVILPTCT